MTTPPPQRQVNHCQGPTSRRRSCATVVLSDIIAAGSVRFVPWVNRGHAIVGLRQGWRCWEACGAGSSRCDSIALTFSPCTPNLNAPKINLTLNTTEKAGQSRCDSSASAFTPNFKCSAPDSATSSTALSDCTKKLWQRRWWRWRRTKSRLPSRAVEERHCPQGRYSVFAT
jgi:hypothetical protein